MGEDFVLDASALLALLLEEPGEAVVRAAVLDGEVAMSAVNFAEVVGKLRRLGPAGQDALNHIDALGIEIVEFNHGQALQVGALEEELRGRGISLGDRACLALARIREWPVLTADCAWATLGRGIDVRLIR